MRTRIGFILAMSFVISACSGAGNANSTDSSAAAEKAINQVNMNQVRANVSAAQTALTTAQSAIGTIFDPTTGAFNWSIFLNGVDFSNLDSTTQTCLANAFPSSNIMALALTAPTDIATALNCVLNDVLTLAGIASGDMTTALSVLNSGLAAATPGSADAVAIQAMITEIQSLQQSYTGVMQMLGSQLTIVTAFLQTLPTLATSLIPIPILSLIGGTLVSDFVNPIVVEIIAFQTKLEAL